MPNHANERLLTARVAPDAGQLYGLKNNES